MKKLGLLLFLSPLLIYGASLIINIKEFTYGAQAIATLFKADAVQNVVTIRSEKDLHRIYKKAEAERVSSYMGQITFDDIESGYYHLDITVDKDVTALPSGEKFVYSNNLTLSPAESKNLEFAISNLDESICGSTYKYNLILDKLQEKKSILKEIVELNAGGSYIKNLNVDGNEICIQINAKDYSRNEKASIGRGDRLGSDGFYLVKNDPTLDIRLDVNSRNVSSSPCYFDDYQELKNWKHCYSDIFTYAGDKINLAIDPFILEFYPSLSVRTGMGHEGLIKNHFYFEGISTTGALSLYQMESKGVKIKKGKSDGIEIVE